MMWSGWILIVVLIVGIVLLMNNNNFLGNQQAAGSNESPLDILKRRYASGEITTEEYEERKRKLEE